MKATLSLWNRHRGFLLLLLASAGCDDQATEPQRSESGSLMSLATSLQSAVAACAETAQSCEAADGGASCRDSFESCREEAKAAAKPDIDKTVNACAEAAKTCREAAQTSEARTACSETLRTCLGAQTKDGAVPDDKPERDAGGKPAASPSSVASCVDALHTCLDGDTPARECTSALRECIATTVGNGGGNGDAGKPDQPGQSGDASKPDQPGQSGDAGKPDQPGQSGDAGKPDDDDDQTADAGAPAEDAGPGMSGASKACKDAFDACVAADAGRESCARMLKDCRMN